MPIEVATTIGGLNPLWPLGTDPKSQGDDHIRMIKSVMQGAGAYQAKSGSYLGVKGDSGTTLVFSAAATLTLDPAATLATGWWINVIADAEVTIDPNGAELIDGLATIVVPANRAVSIYCNGAAFKTDRQHLQAWELIESKAYSNVASWQRIDLAPFRALRLVGFARPATDSVSAYLQVSGNAGSSWDAGAADYGNSWRYGVGGVALGQAAASAVAMVLNQGTLIGNGANTGGVFFDHVFEDFNQAAYTKSHGHGWWFSPANSINDMAGLNAYRVAAAAHNGLRLTFSAGNIASIHVSLFGLRG